MRKTKLKRFHRFTVTLLHHKIMPDVSWESEKNWLSERALRERQNSKCLFAIRKKLVCPNLLE